VADDRGLIGDAESRCHLRKAARCLPKATQHAVRRPRSRLVQSVPSPGRRLTCRSSSTPAAADVPLIHLCYRVQQLRQPAHRLGGYIEIWR
jgi:hypothetical protein